MQFCYKFINNNNKRNRNFFSLRKNKDKFNFISKMEDSASPIDSTRSDQESENTVEDSIELNWALMNYALNSKRLFFIQIPKTWSGFHSDNSENGYKYLDYTPEILCLHFLEQILPQIYDYELTDDEEYQLRLLELHPSFKRTESGFVAMNPTETLQTSAQDLDTIRRLADELDFVESTENLADQIIIEQLDDYCKFQFSDENAALLSMELSSNINLACCELVPIQEIYKRLKNAKPDLENSSHQLEFINNSTEEMLNQLKSALELNGSIDEIAKELFGSKTN